MESKLAESVTDRCRNAYGNELTNMREVVSNYRHRQECKRSDAGNIRKEYVDSGYPVINQAGYTEYYQAISERSINYFKRFIRDMTELCYIMDKKQNQIQIIESSIAQCASSVSKKLLTSALEQAKNHYYLCYDLACLLYMDSMQTQTFDGSRVGNTICTMHERDEKDAVVTAWRQTIKSEIKEQIEALNENESQNVDTFNRITEMVSPEKNKAIRGRDIIMNGNNKFKKDMLPLAS